MVAMLLWFGSLILTVCTFQLVAHGQLPPAIERWAIASFIIGVLGVVVVPLLARSFTDRP